MRKNFNRCYDARSFTWLRLIALLVLLRGLSACDSLMLSTDSPVIRLTDVSPRSLPGWNNTWSWKIEDEVQAYIRLTGEVDEQLVFEFLVAPPDWNPDQDITLRVARPFTGYLTSLTDNWYMAAINVGEEEKDRQTYLLIKIDEGRVSIPSKQALEGNRLIELAMKHGLKLEQDGKMVAKANKKNLVAFFNALRSEVQPRHLQTYSATRPPSGEDYQNAVRHYCDEVNLLPSYTATSKKYLLEASISYFRLLAKRGEGCASYLLARFYLEGQLIEKDYARADAYARKAIDDGFVRAYYVTAYMALHGLGRDKDAKEAEKLFRQAAGAGEPRAMFQLGELALKRKNISQGLSWIERAIAFEYTDAAYQLARFYLDGTGVKQDDRKAFDLFTRVAKRRFNLFAPAPESTHRDAETYLGWMYENGRAVPKDLKQANVHYLMGAVKGNAFARWRIGDNLTRGAGIEKDMKKGMDWLHQAAAHGNARAKQRLDEITAMTDAGKDMIVELPSPAENTGRGSISAKVTFSRPLDDGDSVEILIDGVMAAKMEVSGRTGVTALKTLSLIPPPSGVIGFVLKRRDGETTRLEREWRPVMTPIPHLEIKTRMNGLKWKVTAKDREIQVVFTDSISFFYYIKKFAISTPGGSIRITQTPLINPAPRWQFRTTDSLHDGDVKLASFETTNDPFSEGIPFLQKYSKALEETPVKSVTNVGGYFSARDIARNITGALKTGKLEDGGPVLMKLYCEQTTPMKLGSYIRLCLDDGQPVFKTRGGLWIYRDGRKADPEAVYGL